MGLFAKGGKYSPFYADLHLLLNWKNNGQELKAFPGSVIRNPDFYFYPGLTWCYRTHRLCLQELPRGSVISVRGSGIYADTDTLSTWLSLGNSNILDFLVKLSMGREGHPQFDQGDLKLLPFPNLNAANRDVLSQLAEEGLSLKKFIAGSFEVSLCGMLPAVLRVQRGTLQERILTWQTLLAEKENRLSEIEQEIDRIAAQVYEIENESQIFLDPNVNQYFDENIETDSDSNSEKLSNGRQQLTTDLISYTVGCSFGRWDIRFATGEISAPDPCSFTPLPSYSAGMLKGISGQPTEIGQEAIINYPIQPPSNCILVEDESSPDDIVRHVRNILEMILGNEAEDSEQTICEFLDIRNLRDYFRKPASFFAEHLTLYSRSGRQAPIYLPISTASGSYTLWLYYHRLTDQTLYTCINDYVEPKFNRVSEAVKFLRSTTTRTRDEENDLEDLQTLEDELTKFRDELLRVAKLPWKPNFNDGYKLPSPPSIPCSA